MLSTTVRAYPFPDTEVLDYGISVATTMAKLAAWVEAPHQNNILAIPCRFVPQLTGDFTKRGIRDGLGKVMVCHHTLDVQVLDANHIFPPFFFFFIGIRAPHKAVGQGVRGRSTPDSGHLCNLFY